LKRPLVFFFILLISVQVLSQDQDLNNFLYHIKNQEYITAKENADNWDSVLKDQSSLALILANTLITEKIDSIKIDSKDSVYNPYLYKIIKGYYHRFKDKQDNLLAFKNFSQALQFANDNKNNLQKKVALTSILDVFASEIFIGSKRYQNYLNQYEEIASDKYDRVRVFLYKLIFNSKANENLEVEREYDFLSKSIDKIFSTIETDHPLYRFYLLEKAMVARDKDSFNQSQEYLHALNDNQVFKENNPNFYESIIWQIAFNHFQAKEYKKTIEIIKPRLIDTINLKDRFFNERLYAYSLGGLGKGDSAYTILRKTIDYEYQIGFRNNSLETGILSVENQIDKLKYDKLEADVGRKRNKNVAFGLGGGLLAFSIIGFLIYKNTKRKQRIAEQEKELEIQKTTQILKEKEVETINAMVEGQEKERLRLAGELHDNLGSTLATVKMQVENLERNLEKVDDPKVLLSKTNTLINEAYQKVRRISHERHSGVMAKEGLLPAVQKLAKQISSNGKLQIDVQDFGLENRLSNHLEITIFRIVQELITNIVKHAKATEASISLTQHDSELNIIVEDNGKGFKVGKLETKNGMGLGSIERRVEHLEGSMEVDSTIGKGTNIIIDLPIQSISNEIKD